MRYLHVGDNICGIPSALARAQRAKGHKADVMSFTIDKQGHLADYQYNETNPLKKVLQLLQKVSSYDALLFVGNSLLPRGADIPLWRLLGKKVAIEYHGTEIRGRKQYFFHRFADVIFVSTPDLLEYVPHAIWLPNPIYAEELPRRVEAKECLIVHAPTDRVASGTKYLLEAMQEVHRLHPKAKLVLVEGVAHQEALKRYCEATIVIDKLNTVGYMGMVALEAMAIGIPTMAYVKPNIRRYLPNPPPTYYLSHHEVTGAIEQEIVHLLYDYDYQHLLIETGRKYVTSVHNPARLVSMIDKSLGVNE
jgi:hypothetical protein